MRKSKMHLITVAACLTAAAMCSVMAIHGTALAKKPGGGGGGEDPVRFTVTTEAGSDMQIVGHFDADRNYVEGGAVTGRAGRSNVVVNRPSPAVVMDFLAAEEPDYFTAGTIYGTDNGGSIDIGDSSKGGYFRYFFRAPGIDGVNEVHYRFDGDATIEAKNGGSFPNGDTVGFKVTVNNLVLSQDSGKRGNAVERSFPNATAVFHLDRLP